MKGFSRRSLLNRLLPAAFLGVLFPCRAKAADQPRMQAALDALKIARRELEAATEDKGGHRKRAINLVNQAINQVERGIQFDRRR